MSCTSWVAWGRDRTKSKDAWCTSLSCMKRLFQSMPSKVWQSVMILQTNQNSLGSSLLTNKVNSQLQLMWKHQQETLIRLLKALIIRKQERNSSNNSLVKRERQSLMLLVVSTTLTLRVWLNALQNLTWAFLIVSMWPLLISSTIFHWELKTQFVMTQ
jgi:hypothetical protein